MQIEPYMDIPCQCHSIVKPDRAGLKHQTALARALQGPILLAIRTVSPSSFPFLWPSSELLALSSRPWFVLGKLNQDPEGHDPGGKCSKQLKLGTWALRRKHIRTLHG